MPLLANVPLRRRGCYTNVSHLLLNLSLFESLQVSHFPGEASRSGSKEAMFFVWTIALDSLDFFDKDKWYSRLRSWKYYDDGLKTKDRKCDSNLYYIVPSTHKWLFCGTRRSEVHQT